MRQQNMDQQSGSMQIINSITTNAAESTASSSTNLTSLIKVRAKLVTILLQTDLCALCNAMSVHTLTHICTTCGVL